MLRAIILSSFFLFLVGSLKAQLVLKDSTYIYKKIEGYSNKRPFTKFIYKSFFRFKKKKPDLLQNKFHMLSAKGK